MTEKRSRPDWASILDRAQRNQGKWILIGEMSPSMVERINLRRSRILSEAPGKIEALAAHAYRNDEGQEVAAIYLRMTDAPEPEKIPQRPRKHKTSERPDYFPRKFRVRPGDKEKFRTLAALSSMSESALMRDVLERFVEEGEPEEVQEEKGWAYINAMVSSPLWDAAEERAEQDGIRLVQAFLLQVNRRLRESRK